MTTIPWVYLLELLDNRLDATVSFVVVEDDLYKAYSDGLSGTWSFDVNAPQPNLLYKGTPLVPQSAWENR